MSRGPRRRATSRSRASSWNRRGGSAACTVVIAVKRPSCSRASRARVRSVSSHHSSFVRSRNWERSTWARRTSNSPDAGEQLERPRVDLRLVRDAPRVEGVSRREVVRERFGQRTRELVRERLERDPGSLRLVCEQRALSARLRDRGDARPLGPAAPAEDFEGLDELVEVGDLDRGVPPEHRGERALGADERARVGERRPRRRLRATDLEADDRLPGLGAPAQRVHESVGSAHGLEEEPDRARRGILREEREEVSGVCDRLGPRRHDATQPDAAAQREERVRDRARLAQHCDVTRRGRVLGAPVPRRRAARDEEPHAVRPEERGVELARSSCEPLRGLLRCRAPPRLRPRARRTRGRPRPPPPRTRLRRARG